MVASVNEAAARNALEGRDQSLRGAKAKAIRYKEYSSDGAPMGPPRACTGPCLLCCLLACPFCPSACLPCLPACCVGGAIGGATLL